MPEPPSSDSCEQSSRRPGHSQGIEIHIKRLPHFLAQTAISHEFSQVIGGKMKKKKCARDKTAELYAVVRPIFKGQAFSHPQRKHPIDQRGFSRRLQMSRTEGKIARPLAF